MLFRIGTWCAQYMQADMDTWMLQLAISLNLKKSIHLCKLVIFECVRTFVCLGAAGGSHYDMMERVRGIYFAEILFQHALNYAPQRSYLIFSVCVTYFSVEKKIAQ